MTDARPYTTQLQAGLGLVDETKILLDLWSPGMSGVDLNKTALRSGAFPNMSARRIRNIVIECFAPRYLRHDAQPAQLLKTLLPRLAAGELVQLFFLYTCRANSVLADFVREVYWDRYTSGAERVLKEDARGFIRRAIDDGKTVKRWSESTIIRVSNYLLGACADFGLLGHRDRSGRRIVPFRIENKIVAILAQELHSQRVGDNSLVSHEDWRLFGLAVKDVKSELRRLTLTGQIILQAAGNVSHIGWKHRTMQEFVDDFAQG